MNALETVIQASFEHLSYISCFVLLPVGKCFRQAENKICRFDSVGQLCDSVSSASLFFHSRPVWLFSFESCVYRFPLVTVSVGTGADSSLNRHVMDALATIAGMNLPRHVNAKCNAGSVIGGYASDAIVKRKGTGFQANGGMFAVLSVTNANNTPSFLKSPVRQNC